MFAPRLLTRLSPRNGMIPDVGITHVPYGLAANDILVEVGAYHVSVAEHRMLTWAQAFGSCALRF
jgi:hypothetical protein